MSDPTADERLCRILEACYAALEAGMSPDLRELCAGDAATIRRVENLLANEQGGVSALRAALRQTEDVPDGGSGSAPAAQSQSSPSFRSRLDRVGDFTVLEPLGTGGMSRVYRARQEPLGREVALKILRDDLVATELGRLRFQREATITAALDHPNIVAVYAAGEVDGHVYLAMKLLRGQSLLQLSKPIDPRTVARHGAEVASALQAAHDIGVVHRDVKPANIVVERGTAYVVDFGLSSFTHSAGTITRPDSTPGTLIYLAPELARRQGDGLDARVDVYGLGATLYEAIAGRPPFDGTSPLHVLHQILHRDPAPLRLTGADRDLETIVLRALEKQPSRRFATAAEMGAELRRYLDRLPIRSRRIGWLERALRAIRRRPLQSALIGTIVALAVGLAIVMLVHAAARQRRWGNAIAAVHEAASAGDLRRAERGLAELAADPVDTAQVAALRDEFEMERAVQVLTALLQSPITHQDPSALRTLVAQLAAPQRASTPTCARRAEVALAFASRLLDSSPLVHLPLTPATLAAWPRTGAAVRAWTAGQDPVAAVASLADDADAYDHLFAALAMRLAGRPPEDVEVELRRPRAAGAAADAVAYSLAWTLEAAGQVPTPEARIARRRAAYDVSNVLRESPSYALLAEYQCARLAVLLHDFGRARTHLAAALASGPVAAELRNLTALSELEVLLDLDRDAFWRRWRELQPQCDQLPQFWLSAGYAEVAGDRPGADEVQRARAHFERGLQLSPQPAARADLQLALLQLDAADCPALAELVETGSDDERRNAGEQLAALIARAEAFASSVAATSLSASLRWDALFVAAKAAFAAGERTRAWQLLETACRESGHPAMLAFYAVTVGERILAVQLEADGSLRAPSDVANGDRFDPDAGATAPLADAASRALLRGEQVVAAAGAEQRAVDAQVLEGATIGAFLAAFHVGEPGVALPLACTLRDRIHGPPLEPLVECALADGGFRADVWLANVAPEAPRTAALLLDACASMRALLGQKRLDPPQVKNALARWRGSESLRRTAAVTTEPWPSVWREIEALDAFAAAAVK